jgi:hypothetical protein
MATDGAVVRGLLFLDLTPWVQRGRGGGAAAIGGERGILDRNGDGDGQLTSFAWCLSEWLGDLMNYTRSRQYVPSIETRWADNSIRTEMCVFVVDRRRLPGRR